MIYIHCWNVDCSLISMPMVINLSIVVKTLVFHTILFSFYASRASNAQILLFHIRIATQSEIAFPMNVDLLLL